MTLPRDLCWRGSSDKLKGRPHWKRTTATQSPDYRFYYALIIFTLYGRIKSYYFLLQLHSHKSFCLFPPLFHFQDDSGSVSGHQLPMVNVQTGRNNVLNRVSTQQDKWKRQVWTTFVSCMWAVNNLFATFRSKSNDLEFIIQCWTKPRQTNEFMQLSFQKIKDKPKGGFEPV